MRRTRSCPPARPGRCSQRPCCTSGVCRAFGVPRLLSRFPPAGARRCSSTPARTPTRGRRTSSSSPTWAPSSRTRFSASSDPLVRLLSIGEEDEKGNQLTLDAHALLRASSLRFGGNTESRSLLEGDSDVVVTDGFTGNVALKALEGTIRSVLDVAARGELELVRAWEARRASDPPFGQAGALERSTRRPTAAPICSDCAASS